MSFTKKQLQIAKLKHKGLSNRDIAKNVKTSEANVSQTLKTVISKIKTVQDSTDLLMDMGIIAKPKYIITNRGFNRITIPSGDLRRVANTSTTVAVLGPRGTNSERAAKEFYGEDIGIDPKKDFEEIFDAVEEESVDFGLVPVHETREGDIESVQNLLQDRQVKIVGKTQLEVKHCLLGKKDKKDLKYIGSHPRVLLVCRNYLKNNFPDVHRIETNSTAEAAVIASTNVKFGAIGSEWLSEEYGLNMLEHNIANNVTTFNAIAPLSKMIKLKVKKPLETQIFISSKGNSIGMLANILEPFREDKINIQNLRVEFRNSLKNPGFLLVFKGSATTPEAKRVLEKIKDLNSVKKVKIIGSYPVNNIIMKN